MLRRARGAVKNLFEPWWPRGPGLGPPAGSSHEAVPPAVAKSRAEWPPAHGLFRGDPAMGRDPINSVTAPQPESYSLA